jgi:hypothetical protein
MQDRIDELERINKMLIEALTEALLQVEYLDEKFEATATTAAVLTRGHGTLALAKGGK